MYTAKYCSPSQWSSRVHMTGTHHRANGLFASQWMTSRITTQNIIKFLTMIQERSGSQLPHAGGCCQPLRLLFGRRRWCSESAECFCVADTLGELDYTSHPQADGSSDKLLFTSAISWFTCSSSLRRVSCHASRLFLVFSSSAFDYVRELIFA